jgi:hypothetical protein
MFVSIKKIRCRLDCNLVDVNEYTLTYHCMAGELVIYSIGPA